MAGQRAPTEECDGTSDGTASRRSAGTGRYRTKILPVETAGNLSALPWKDAREQYLANFERSYAQAVLARCGGNVSAAAREAGVDRKTFYALLKREKEPQTGESIPQPAPEMRGIDIPNHPKRSESK